LLSASLKGIKSNEMTCLTIAAVIVGVTLGDVGFYLGTGTTPGSALGQPLWSSLGLGAFGIAIALKSAVLHGGRSSDGPCTRDLSP
jgi:hypothetical protein